MYTRAPVPWDALLVSFLRSILLDAKNALAERFSASVLGRLAGATTPSS